MPLFVSKGRRWIPHRCINNHTNEEEKNRKSQVCVYVHMHVNLILSTYLIYAYGSVYGVPYVCMYPTVRYPAAKLLLVWSSSMPKLEYVRRCKYIGLGALVTRHYVAG